MAKNEQLETYEEQGDISSRTDNVDGKNLATSRNKLFHHEPFPRNLPLHLTCVTEYVWTHYKMHVFYGK